MSENLSRRNFFKATAGLGMAAALRWQDSFAQTPDGSPIFLSTWRQGKPACQKAAEVLRAGGSLLDAIEKGINTAELDPTVMSVGYGALPNAEGELELDAAIMDGPTHNGAAVASLKMIKTPISVARRVMEKTTHTLLAGEGALRFAIAEGFQAEQLLTPAALERWQEWKANPEREQFWRRAADDMAEVQALLGDTITMVGNDGRGNLAAGGSTSGLAWKIPGRVGDVPLIGCGIYVDNDVGAAGATGNGDEMIKFCTSLSIVERMRAGMSPQQACEDLLRWMVRKNPANRSTSACVYALNKRGEYGAATLGRPFTYAIWTPQLSELREVQPLL